MGKRIAAVLVVVAVVVLMPSSTNAATKVVTGSLDDGFLPPTLKVNLGDTVRWEADDLAQHNATSKDGTTFATSFGPTRPGAWLATKAGTFPYICTIHGEQAMSGTIVVKAAPIATTTSASTTTTARAKSTTTAAPATTTTAAPASTSSTDSTTTSSSSTTSTSTTLDPDSQAAITIVDDDGGGGGGSGTAIAIAALVLGAIVAASGAWVLWKRGELAPGNDR